MNIVIGIVQNPKITRIKHDITRRFWVKMDNGNFLKCECETYLEATLIRTTRAGSTCLIARNENNKTVDWMIF